MTEPTDFEAWFSENQPLVDVLVTYVIRRLGFRGDDADEFRSCAKEMLWEDDYAVLRKWRRESSVKTYLTVVLLRFGYEFRLKHWGGRWRPSAAALRLGPEAVRLERLVHRDGLRLEEAGELMRTRGETTMTDRQLAGLLAQLPARGRVRPGGDREVPIDTIADGRRADDSMVEEETDAERDSAARLLDAAIATLDPLEQNVIRMHFLKGLTLADVARALDVEQKPLYRVKDRALLTLRRYLMSAGLTAEHLRDFFGGALPERDEPADDELDSGGSPGSGGPMGGSPVQGGPRGKTGGPRPSNESCDSSPSDAASGSFDSERSERSDT